MERGEIRSELATWADGTPYTTDELYVAYLDYCTIATEDGDEPMSPAQWAEEEMGIENCDECGKALDAGELDRNRVENEDENGNSFWCDKCAAAKRAEANESVEE